MTSLRLLKVASPRQFNVAIFLLSGCGTGKNNVKSNIEQENFDASVKIRPQIFFRHYNCTLHVHMYCLFTMI